jgi:hypothetical protein
VYPQAVTVAYRLCRRRLKNDPGVDELTRRKGVNFQPPLTDCRPARARVTCKFRGVTWRRIRFEVAPDEAGIGEDFEAIEPPPLSGFGLPDPDTLVGIAMRFQIAQKVHAVSDPHEPPDSINDRARDVVDLVLLRDLVADTRSPTLAEIRAAGTAVFQARADEAQQLGLPARTWPPAVIGHAHWRHDYQRAAASASIELSLDAAVAEINAWIAEVDKA